MPGPNPEAAPLRPPGGLNIFLSSTIKDYETLRDKVRDVLLRKAECACFPSEEWVGGYAGTLATCRQRVLEAGGFILMLGYWYGSVPPQEEKSITHFEFEWALDKWNREQFPKMAVLRPKPDSPAARQLKALAEPLLPKSPLDLLQHEERLRRFHEQVDDRRGEWRTIKSFKDDEELLQDTIVFGLKWRGQTPLAASQGRVAIEPDYAADSRLSAPMLGALGRQPQETTIQKTLARLSGTPEAPAVAMVVHGDEDAGQRAFLARIIHRWLNKLHPKPAIGRLPLGKPTIPALVAWLARTLGLPNPVGIATPEQLADQVALELQHQPMGFVLDRIGDLQGGARSFQRDFWRPFWSRLRMLRQQTPTPHRLVAVLADYTGNPDAWGETVMPPPAPGAPTDDYARLLLIPRLGPFSDDDLLSWLEEMEVPDDASGRRAELVRRVLHNEAGALDPTPLHVFNRLLGETLWT